MRRIDLSQACLFEPSTFYDGIIFHSSGFDGWPDFPHGLRIAETVPSRCCTSEESAVMDNEGIGRPSSRKLHPRSGEWDRIFQVWRTVRINHGRGTGTASFCMPRKRDPRQRIELRAERFLEVRLVRANLLDQREKKTLTTHRRAGPLHHIIII